MNFFHLFKKLFVLKHNVKKSRKQIQIMQNKKLRTILHYAYDYSPFYRASFEANGIDKTNIDTRPLTDFPTLNKDTMMAHFDELVTVSDVTQAELSQFAESGHQDQAVYHQKYHIVHSSGSTGIPRYFLYDEAAWEDMLTGVIRGALWDLSFMQMVKLVFGGLRILYIAAVNGRYGGAMAVGAGVDCLDGKRLFIDVNTPLKRWIAQIITFKPNIIVGYPSALKILAEIVEKGTVSLNVKRVISCGEPLGQGTRNYFERVFNATIVNFYGASESLALGVEVSTDDGMVLFDDLNVIEEIEGQVFLTSLYNFAQPLIRYHLSDKLQLNHDLTEISSFTHAHVLLSRNEDVLWFERDDGHRDFLHPLSIEGFCIDGLIDFQFYQTGKDSFEMLAQVEDSKRRDSVKNEMNRQMSEILKEKDLAHLDFSIRFIDEILPDSQTGKKRLIIDKEELGSLA